MAATHKHLRDEEGNVNFPGSARYHAPTFFAWMTTNEQLINGDLSDVVNIVASKDEIERRSVDDWEARHRATTRGE